MIKPMVTIVLLIGVLTAWSPAQGKFLREAKWIFSIADKITSEDALHVKTALQAIKPETMPLSVRPLFYLNSPGGDIYAAMEMGRLLRKARATCIVPAHKQCASACVFVLAGCIERSVYGKVAIHRPYSTYVGLRDYESAEKEYRRTETAAKHYLKEMNLSDKLYEAMVQIPPEQIRVLGRKEIEDFSLIGIDPVEQKKCGTLPWLPDMVFLSANTCHGRVESNQPVRRFRTNHPTRKLTKA
jgi:ATP-dependent protease ClpP protease subunit